MRSTLCERKTLHIEYPGNSDFDSGVDALANSIFDPTRDPSRSD